MAEWDSSVRRRPSFCWIENEAGERVGALDLAEVKMSPLETNESFVEAMDCHSQETYDFAYEVCAGWDDLPAQVAEWGPLVEFQAAWVQPSQTPHGLWAVIANELLRRRYANRSVLLMKTFPLEYRGHRSLEGEFQAAFDSRQAAMRRYYGKLFGVRELPGGYDWLWARGPRSAAVDPDDGG